jgi:hypothetical protein
MGNSIAIAVVCSLVALVAADGSAIAQAGSTGGTLGKTDKSASGGEDTVEPRGRPKRERPLRERDNRASCRKFVGAWSWYQGGETVLNQDGSGHQSHGTTGMWTCAGGILTATWTSGFVDRMMISSDGNSLLVTNNHGTTFAATRNK